MSRLDRSYIKTRAAAAVLAAVALDPAKLRAEDSAADDGRRSAPRTEAPASRARADDCCSAAPGGSAAGYRRSRVEYRPPDRVLVDMTDRRVPLASALAPGRLVVLQFGFTTCSTVCPVMAGTVETVQNALRARGRAEASRVRFVTISIDPEHDTPERLRRFAADFHAGPEWMFYTGRLDDVAAIQKAFDAYPGNKSRHGPLTFLRAADGGPWTRIDGLCSAGDLIREIDLALESSD